MPTTNQTPRLKQLLQLCMVPPQWESVILSLATHLKTYSMECAFALYSPHIVATKYVFLPHTSLTIYFSTTNCSLM